MAEPHQPPYAIQPPPPPQQHQSMASWYGMPPHVYQAQQAPAPPPQHHAMPWAAATMPPPPPPGEQVYSYSSQPYHAPSQGDFYPRQQQVHHQYPPPPQPAQPQFTYMYGQQDQVWQQANNSWGYQQWPHPVQTASLSQEEVWAAKARAWAASKAVQDEPRPSPNAPQIHQDYMFQPQEQHPQPPGQDATSVHSYHHNTINQGQSAQQRGQSEPPPQSLGYGQPTQDITPSIVPESVLEQKAAQVGGQPHANDSQAMFSSSQVHDAAASYGLDTIMTGPQGNDRIDSISQVHPKKLPAAPVYTQQATHLLPQSQASPLISQPHLPYSDKFSAAGYEQQQQQQQLSSAYLQPPPPPPPQQPPARVPHQPQNLPLQTHYPASVTLEGVEGEFGLSPRSLQNWAPVGGPGMPFPPAMGAGTSQFDAVHQLPVPWRPDGFQGGPGLQGLGFPNSAPFAVGTSPGLGPGVGPPGRPLFAPESFVERPKKAAVPSWLREELMKKKAAGLTGNASGMLSSDESNRVNGGETANPLVQRVGISDKLRSSSPGLSEDEEEDQEEEIEAARSAAINQEIKRLLTEVLLKVTGDLFKEIAQEVLDEDGDDMLQGTSSPDERSRIVRPASPSSPGVGPLSSGRVFVSSGKIPATDDGGKDKESSDSGEAPGDVLGLGNYASDDETVNPKDDEESLHHSNTETEKRDLETINSVDQVKYEENAHKGKIAHGALQSNEPVLKMKRISEDDTNQVTIAHHLDVQNGRSPIRRDLGASSTQARMNENIGQWQSASEQSSSKERNNSMSKGEGKNQDTTVRFVPGDTSIKKLDNKETGHGQDTLIKDRKKEEKREDRETGHSQDTFIKDRKREEKREDRETGHSQDTLIKDRKKEEKTEDRETDHSKDTLIKDRKKEEKREDRAKDLSVKERKREDKPAIESKSREERDDRPKAKSDTSSKERNMEEKMKDVKEVKRARGSESRIRESSRERRKEKDKVKEKLKPRERESDRDRRKQEKREREGRSKRGDAVEKKARHRLTSSSPSAGREGSSSSNSDRSRGRLRTRRSSRHHTSTSSPGRSRKRRASRSRSRSRSPHVKHTHRRNVPSPSHEKSRRSGSKSPIHRRGRG